MRSAQLGVIFCLDFVVLSIFLYCSLIGCFSLVYLFHKTCCEAINPYGATWINIDEVVGRRAWSKNPSMQSLISKVIQASICGKPF